MSADVHAVAIVADGAGDASKALGGFQNDGAHIGASQQLKRCGQAGRSGSNDDGGFHAQVLQPSDRYAAI
jgi:hypothetical protein